MSDTQMIHDFREHDWITTSVSEDEIHYRQQPENGDISKIWAFGLAPGGRLSYYVGLDWLDKSHVLRVKPKIYGDGREPDYHVMFMECLSSPVTASYLGDAYDIRLDKPFIEVANDEFDFSPFLAHHFLHLLKDLFKRPLKKGYVQREENLTAKLKGKIMIGAHFKKNVLGMRPDRVMCRYQEYSVDCIENRLLHSAYRIALNYLKSLRSNTVNGVRTIALYESLAEYFQNIGTIKHPYELHGIKSNPLYREYAETLRLAKMIFSHKGYQIADMTTKKTVPPFIIDMAKLFELYAYVQLSKIPDTILDYQSKGKYGNTDFLDIKNKIVIDAKYKYQYSDKYEADDIRQIAGYARDIGILEKLRVRGEDRNEVIDCMVVYPNHNSDAEIASQYYQRKILPNTLIKQFYRYYKVGIRLPEVE
ncbi:MAG: hypothetical protein JXB42_10505 [Deltaproteobacteria bacterium]|nr:hypothetical protein [Deltaproteobacteria bacterium]